MEADKRLEYAQVHDKHRSQANRMLALIHLGDQRLTGD